jgi:malonyl CoA-acyl carrier protein transacylase
MSGADRVIRWSTAFAVLGVAAVAAVASYEHAYDLVRARGGRVHGAPGPVHGGRADLRELDGDA